MTLPEHKDDEEETEPMKATNGSVTCLCHGLVFCRARTKIKQLPARGTNMRKFASLNIPRWSLHTICFIGVQENIQLASLLQICLTPPPPQPRWATVTAPGQLLRYIVLNLRLSLPPCFRT